VGVLELLSGIVGQSLWVLYEGAFFILIGFAVAGAVHRFVEPDRIVRYLGERSLTSAALAAILGAPLPLCSCGVLPTAVSLRRKGASPEATLSFLVTTPETGIDSIALTFAFFGPLFAFVRVVVAIATGLAAAALSLRHWPLGEEPALEPSADPHVPSSDAPKAAAHEAHEARVRQRNVSRPQRLTAIIRRFRIEARHAARYAFGELLDELAFWLAFAIVVTGVLSAILPADFFTRLFPSSFAAMVVLAVLSIPLYVCASASTPLAALFVTKGASAGAALVFLLVGPATNAAAVATVARLFGRPFLRVYLGAIVGVAIAAGWCVDLLLPGLAAGVRIGETTEYAPLSVLKLGAMLVLGWLLVESLVRTGLRPGLSELAETARAVASAIRRLEPRTALLHPAVLGIAFLWLLSTLVGSVWRVPIGNRAIIQRLGRVAGSPREPGLAFAAPLIDHVELLRVDEVRERPVGYRTAPPALTRVPVPSEAFYLTADENVIDLHAEVQYRVADAVRYRLAVEAPDDVLSACVRARLVEAMATRPIDLVYTNDRADVESWLLAEVRRDVEKMDLGVQVLGVRLLDVHAPASVHDAFRDVASAHEDRQTTIHHANEYAAGIVAVARGEAERLVSQAQAESFERRALAEGSAKAFAALAAEHKRAPDLTEARLYLEAAERVLPGARKVVRPAGGATRGYELWLRGSGAPILFPPTEPGEAQPDERLP
jgi:HflK protein